MVGNYKIHSYNSPQIQGCSTNTAVNALYHSQLTQQQQQQQYQQQQQNVQLQRLPAGLQIDGVLRSHIARRRLRELANRKPQVIKRNFCRNMDLVCNPLQQNKIVKQGLDLRLQAKRAKDCVKLGCLNALVLAFIVFDLSCKCPLAHSKWYYVEYALGILSGLTVVLTFAKYLVYLLFTEPIHVTKQQKQLMLLSGKDLKNTVLIDDQTIFPNQTINSAHSDSCADVDDDLILNWHSSLNDSRLNSTNWSYLRRTPTGLTFSPQRRSLSPQAAAGAATTPQCISPQQRQQNISLQNTFPNNSSMLSNISAASSNNTFASPYIRYERGDMINDERSLKEYLREVSKRENSLHDEAADASQTFNAGSINSFWNYCNTAANLLKTSIYQLAPIPSQTTPNKQTAKDEVFNFMDSNSELIKRISSEKLSRYVANLRMWISTTILIRLANEINKIDDSFKNRGLVDMQIGNIGLERLKKTVENQHFVNQFMPMLPLIVPFLEMSANQEYLVQRIKDLAKGSCIADYRWNSGSSYHGLKWDEHLPTDSAILFHLFCVYLDSQLLPLPQGGGRPFYSRYVIIGDDKRSNKDTLAAVQNKAKCAILCKNPLKPKFNFITDQEIHNCAHDRNNLFYVIIQFLIYMKTHHESALEGVNLGRSGINIMCVIED